MGVKLLRLNLKINAVYHLLYALANTLSLAIIFMLIEVNLVHFKKRKNLSKVNWEIGKCIFFQFFPSIKRTPQRLSNTLLKSGSQLPKMTSMKALQK